AAQPARQQPLLEPAEGGPARRPDRVLGADPALARAEPGADLGHGLGDDLGVDDRPGRLVARQQLGPERSVRRHHPHRAGPGAAPGAGPPPWGPPGFFPPERADFDPSLDGDWKEAPIRLAGPGRRP